MNYHIQDFEQNSHLHIIGQGFLFKSSIKKIILPLEILIIGPFSFASLDLEEIIYCGNQHFNEAKIFQYDNNIFNSPKKLYVKKDYQFSNFGPITNLTKSSICYKYFGKRITNNCKRYRLNMILFILIIIKI